jgi:hypothetical protein
MRGSAIMYNVVEVFGNLYEKDRYIEACESKFEYSLVEYYVLFLGQSC